jgi:hypothetical protein
MPWGPPAPGGLHRPIYPPLGASASEDRALADAVSTRDPIVWKQWAQSTGDGAEACAVGDILR